MERAQTTKKNDAVTLRQFNLFLKTANLPSQFKGTVKQFKDVVQQMPIILQDLLFAEWISQHLKKVHNIQVFLVIVVQVVIHVTTKWILLDLIGLSLHGGSFHNS